MFIYIKTRFLAYVWWIHVRHFKQDTATLCLCTVKGTREMRTWCYLPKYGVLVVELIGSTQREKELAAVIVRASVRHGNQPSSVKAQSGMELILERRINPHTVTLSWSFFKNQDHSRICNGMGWDGEINIPSVTPKVYKRHSCFKAWHLILNMN